MKIRYAVIAAVITAVVASTVAVYASKPPSADMELALQTTSGTAESAGPATKAPTSGAADCQKVWVHRVDDPQGLFVWIQVWGDSVTSAALASCNQFGRHVDAIEDMPVTLHGADVNIPRMAVYMDGANGGTFFVPTALASKVARLVTNETDDGLGIYEGWLEDAATAPDGNPDYILQKVQ